MSTNETEPEDIAIEYRVIWDGEVVGRVFARDAAQAQVFAEMDLSVEEVE